MKYTKRSILLAWLISVVTLTNSASATLVGHWTFDETSATTAADSSGFGQDGTVPGTTSWQPGIVGGALEFAGAFQGSVDVTATAAGLQTLDSEITLAFWQFGLTVAANPNTIIKTNILGGTGPLLNLHLPFFGQIVFWDAGEPRDRISKTAIATDYTGQWNHWAFTKNNTDGTQKIYLNGALWLDGLAPNGGSMLGITELNIGTDYQGLLDELRIYDTELSETEIADLAIVSGDFDDDGDVDGGDFLAWQRGESNSPLSPGDLVAWETTYGADLGLLAAGVAVAVPEPTSTLLLGAGGLALIALCRGQKKRSREV